MNNIDHHELPCKAPLAKALVRSDASSSIIAGICLSDSHLLDKLLAGIATEYLKKGFIVSGYLQSEDSSGIGRRGKIFLRCISEERMINISQNLGRCSKGCRTDDMALASANFLIEKRLDKDIDLLILNRFGRSESEGKGLRSVIEKAFLLDIPTLIPVRAKYQLQWQDFTDGFAVKLNPNYREIANWCDTVLQIPSLTTVL